MRKFICVFIVSVLVLSALAGCGDNKSDQEASQADTSSKEEVTFFSYVPEIDEEFKVARNIFQIRKVEKRTFVDELTGRSIPYCLILPKKYDETKKYPVLLYLHGAGERGNGNFEQLRNGVGNMYTVAGKHLDNAIFVAPQCPADDWWNVHANSNTDFRGSLSSVRRLLNSITKKYSCDENRFYVMGYSMGGFGTWEMIGNYNDLFAAAIPICGWWDTMRAEQVCDIPIWIYHGTEDPTVSYYSSQSMYDAIVAADGKKVKLTALEGVGHNAWDYTAVDKDLYDWLFAQSKS